MLKRSNFKVHFGYRYILDIGGERYIFEKGVFYLGDFKAQSFPDLPGIGESKKCTVNRGKVNTCSIVKHDIRGTQKHKEARYIEGHGKLGPGKLRYNCTYFGKKFISFIFLCILKHILKKRPNLCIFWKEVHFILCIS